MYNYTAINSCTSEVMTVAVARIKSLDVSLTFSIEHTSYTVAEQTSQKILNS